ncbi:MAG: pantetheine-phosphate adenylyltransferase [Candidatus Latescibacteria bacterium]|nr:pantetheine-phosphate adenylyltransferase [Candidatus Latescibacterota bacterium]
MQSAFYPGSFDPITNGHLNIIERAGAIFERIVVLVAINPLKKPLFAAEENIAMIRTATRAIDGVEVDYTEGLTTDYARTKDISIMVRGLRAVTDFENEFSMALTNRILWPQADTVFLMTSADYMYLSSSTVRQIAQMGGDIGHFVPSCVEQALKRKFGYS